MLQVRAQLYTPLKENAELQLSIGILHCEGLRALLRGEAPLPNSECGRGDMDLRTLSKGERGSLLCERA